MRKKILFAVAISIVALGACKKSKDSTPDPGPGSTIDKIKDTTIEYARDIYLWYSQIPSNFDAQKYSDPNKIMEAIRTYSKEPGFTNPVDRWSFAVGQAEWDNVSGGVSKDFGLNIFFRAEGDLRVRSVEAASPAGLAGVRRGWRITKINGSSNITTANADFIVNAVYYGSSTSFTFQKPDNSTVDLTLSAGTYQENPFFLDSVYTQGASKIGYIVFNSFLGDTTAIYNKMAAVFNRFATEGVNEVVVDLRYNGGGYVSMQQRFANYLINTAGNGGVMMNQQYNDKYSLYNSTAKFNKLGSLNLSRIFFIVSNNTASASELLINVLKPYMTVKIVGPSASYGKPVGYFAIPVGSWYIFPVSSRSTNKNGEGSYFAGFTPDKIVADGIDKDWGDKDEASFSSILKFLNTGVFGLAEVPSSAAGQTTKEAITRSNEKFSFKIFKGAVENKPY